jgi:hypothetical protein
MERVIERAGGVDVHKKTVAACVRIPGARGEREHRVRTFGTTTAELLTLRDWLQAHGVTHVAMESTGGYWRPIYSVLEDAFTCVLANAGQIAQVPGRKTDVKDCVCIAQLLEHGLIPGGASCRQCRFGRCGISRGIARRSSRSGPTRPTACTRCSRTRGSSWRRGPATSLGVGPGHGRGPGPRHHGPDGPGRLGPAARCARSCRGCARPWPGGFARQTTYQEPGTDYYDRRQPSGPGTPPSRHWNGRATASVSNPRPEARGLIRAGSF